MSRKFTVSPSSRSITAAIDTGLSYWYYGRHGIGPGTIPQGVTVLDTVEEGWKTWMLLDKLLTTEELNYYDLKEQWPPEGSVTHNGEVIESSTEVGEDIDATTLIRYMNYRILPDTYEGGWKVLDSKGEFMRSGFTTTQKAKAYIDTLGSEVTSSTKIEASEDDSHFESRLDTYEDNLIRAAKASGISAVLVDETEEDGTAKYFYKLKKDEKELGDVELGLDLDDDSAYAVYNNKVYAPIKSGMKKLIDAVVTDNGSTDIEGSSEQPLSEKQPIEGADWEVPDQQLDPPEVPEPNTFDIESLQEVAIDCDIIVDAEGGYTYTDSTYPWAVSPDGGDWYEDEYGIYLTDIVGMVEIIDNLFEKLPEFPKEPGRYHLTGYANVYFGINDIDEYKTFEGLDEDEEPMYDSQIDTDTTKVTVLYDESNIQDFDAQKVDDILNSSTDVFSEVDKYVAGLASL